MATRDQLFRTVIPKRVKYTRSIISYLDILGFQDLIEKKTAGEISQLLRILAESGAGDGNRIDFPISKTMQDKALTTAPKVNCCQLVPNKRIWQLE
jgi:hypothetical protein